MSNTQIDPYGFAAPPGPDYSAIAQNLLDRGIFWPFDDDTMASVNGGNTFAQTYGGSVGYEDGVISDRQLVGTHALRTISPFTDNTDWSLAWFWDPTETQVEETGVGVGTLAVNDTNYHAALWRMPNHNLGTYIRTNGDIGTEQGSYIGGPGSSALIACVVTWTESDKTFRSYINGSLFADETLVSSPPAGSNGFIFIRNSTGVSFTEIIPHIDELSAYPGYALTTEDVEYVALGKSYEAMLLDAAG